MRLLHGSYMNIEKPDLTKCKCKQKGLRIKEFDGFTSEWAKFILQNRKASNFKHEYDIVIGPVADAIVDQEIDAFKEEYGDDYLEDNQLREFASRISQFGHSYIQYCFCTQRAIDELIKD